MKYLKKFNEHNDYEEYIEGRDKQLPNVSVCVNESHKHFTQKPRPLIAKFFVNGAKNVKIWIDDFPQDVAEDDYGGDMDAFKEYFVENYELADPYQYTGATFELEGETYYLFEYLRTEEEDESGYRNCHYILTDTLNFRGKSFSEDLQNNYCPAIYTLGIDMGTYDWNTGDIDTDKLLVRYEYLASKTKLINTDRIGLVDKIEIDGVVQDEVISEYDFTEEGEHIVRYKLKGNTAIEAELFYGCDMDEIIISNGIVDVLDDAFCYCKNLTSITVSKTVDDFSSRFDETNLQKIVVDSRNTKYDSRDNCNAIILTDTNTLLNGCEGTVIPSSVTSIDDYAFYNVKIDSINIPNNITYIGDNAFENTTYLNYVKFESTTPPTIGTNVFDCDNDYPIYVPRQSVNTYKSATNWSTYEDRIMCEYKEQYFTTVALESGTISFHIPLDMGTEYIKSISYSTDDGVTWVTTQNQDDKSSSIFITVNVNEGDKVLWKGDAKSFSYGVADSYSQFYSTCEIDVMGNIMSLLYGDDFENKFTAEGEEWFGPLFGDVLNGTEICKIVNAKNLILSATTLTEYCYRGMFYNCSSLVSTPQLPATTLAEGCYDGMFAYCASLTSAPQLHATTLVSGCYNSMFNGCTSLTSAPELSATTLTEYCYRGMFYNCSSLVSTPQLPATTLAEGCYDGMFAYCTSLTTAPQLPATTLAEWCYDSMFYNCTSLTTAPELPATTLAEGCYDNMFRGCTNLTSAPELPATTLTSYCYYYMFEGCWRLNYIKAMFTTTPGVSYTKNWVDGVAANGTFVKNSAATWNVSGVDGIPTGWTVQTASE